MKTTSPRARFQCGHIWYDLFKIVTTDAAGIINSNGAWNSTFMARTVGRDHFYNILPCIESELKSVS